MKKLLTIALLAVIAMFVATSSMAQPVSPTLTADVYDSTPDAVITPNDDNDGAPDINDAVNVLLGTTYANNEDIDDRQVTTGDVTWKDLSDEDFGGTFVLIGLTAARHNTLQVYDTANPGVHVPVLGPISGFGFHGDGTEFNPYIAEFSPLAAGSNFGFSLFSTGNGPDRLWDSKPSNNVDGYDHMFTYQLADLAGKSIWIEYNCTYNDATPDVSLVVCADKVQYTFSNPYLIAWEDKPTLNGLIGDEDYDDLLFLVDRVAPVPEPMSLMLLGSGLAGLASIRRRKV